MRSGHNPPGTVRQERQSLRMKKQLARLDLLILGELGYVPASRLGVELLFDVISTAYERNSILVTTNHSPSAPSSERRLHRRFQVFILPVGAENWRRARTPILSVSRQLGNVTHEARGVASLLPSGEAQVTRWSRGRDADDRKSCCR
jgi:hypothetical protein